MLEFIILSHFLTTQAFGIFGNITQMFNKIIVPHILLIITCAEYKPVTLVYTELDIQCYYHWVRLSVCHLLFIVISFDVTLLFIRI